MKLWILFSFGLGCLGLSALWLAGARRRAREERAYYEGERLSEQIAHERRVNERDWIYPKK